MSRQRSRSFLPGLLLVGACLLSAAHNAHAQAQFAEPNQWQVSCAAALVEVMDPEIWPQEVRSFKEWEAWGKKKYGSQEAYGRAFEAARRAELQKKVNLLRPGAEAGHLPSMSIMLSYFRPSPVLEGVEDLPTEREREAWARRLYESGFPLAPVPTPPNAYDHGFHGNHKPHPTEEFLGKIKQQAVPRIREEMARNPYTSHEDAVELRTAYVQSLRWSAERGQTSSWKDLESAYDQIVRNFGGGIEYQIERYALLELTKRLWTLGSGAFDAGNVPGSDQSALAKKIEAEGELPRARELADRYVRELWPRRIERSTDGVTCRLRPQFSRDSDPYKTAALVLRELETPVPPALQPKPEPRYRITPTPADHPINRFQCGGSAGVTSGCY